MIPASDCFSAVAGPAQPVLYVPQLLWEFGLGFRGLKFRV